MSLVDDLRDRADACRRVASSNFGLGQRLTGRQRQGKADAYEHAADLLEQDPDLVSRDAVVAWLLARSKEAEDRTYVYCREATALCNAAAALLNGDGP